MPGKHEHHIWKEAHNEILQTSQKYLPTWIAKSSDELVDLQVSEFFRESLQDLGNNVRSESIVMWIHRSFVFQECYWTDQESSR